MTVQGASEYVRRMTQAGLLQRVEGEYRATKKGVEFLQDRFVELRSFVERAGRAMAFIITTTALAGTAIRAGDPVGLFMEEGVLVSYANRESGSRGIANEDAAEGEDVAVRNLEGIVGLNPGRILLARIPSKEDGGAKSFRAAAGKRIRSVRGRITAAVDVAGLVAAKKLDLRVDIRFAVLSAVIEAAELGVDVLVLVPEERAAEAVQAIEAANTRLEDKIPYESIALR